MLAAATLAPAIVTACGSDGSDLPEDERVRQIAGVAELAANAYATAGPEGLYDYLASSVEADCSKEVLAHALAGEPVPDGFRRIDGVTFEGDAARATVVQLFAEEDRAAEWTFASVDGSWRITQVPGLEKCTD